MENQPKLNSSKEVIAYLAEKFPRCFTLEGEARPLKIGIFQDVIARLPEETLFSKTQLRTALRLYTSSWRYLHGLKADAQRVDLDGADCGALEAQHVEHARKQLEEAKARVQAQRAAQRKEKEGKEKSEAPVRRSRPAAKKGAESNSATAKPAARRAPQSKAPAKPQLRTTPVGDIGLLKIGQPVQVLAGKSAMDATVLEIAKDGVRVQLASGLAMLVRAEHLQF